MILQADPQFCAACGSKTYSLWAGWKRSCSSALDPEGAEGKGPCFSLQGLHNFAYPRTDSVSGHFSHIAATHQWSQKRAMMKDLALQLTSRWSSWVSSILPAKRCCSAGKSRGLKVCHTSRLDSDGSIAPHSSMSGKRSNAAWRTDARGLMLIRRHVLLFGRLHRAWGIVRRGRTERSFRRGGCPGGPGPIVSVLFPLNPLSDRSIESGRVSRDGFCDYASVPCCISLDTLACSHTAHPPNHGPTQPTSWSAALAAPSTRPSRSA